MVIDGDLIIQSASDTPVELPKLLYTIPFQRRTMTRRIQYRHHQWQNFGSKLIKRDMLDNITWKRATTCYALQVADALPRWRRQGQLISGEHIPREKSRTLITKKGMMSCPFLSVAKSSIPSCMRIPEKTSLPKSPIRIGAICTIKFVGGQIRTFIIMFDEWLRLERPVGASLSTPTTTPTTTPSTMNRY